MLQAAQRALLGLPSAASSETIGGLRPVGISTLALQLLQTASTDSSQVAKPNPIFPPSAQLSRGY